MTATAQLVGEILTRCGDLERAAASAQWESAERPLIELQAMIQRLGTAPGAGELSARQHQALRDVARRVRTSAAELAARRDLLGGELRAARARARAANSYREAAGGR